MTVTQGWSLAIAGCILAIATLMAVLPPYNVWSSKLAGEAELRRAEQERQILIEQAKAEEQAAEHRAAAIAIVGEAAQKYPEYRLQEFLGQFGEAMVNGDIEKIILVPTEGNIPVVQGMPLMRGGGTH